MQRGEQGSAGQRTEVSSAVDRGQQVVGQGQQGSEQESAEPRTGVRGAEDGVTRTGYRGQQGSGQRVCRAVDRG